MGIAASNGRCPCGLLSIPSPMIRTILRGSTPVVSLRVVRVEGFGLERSRGRWVVLGLLW